MRALSATEAGDWLRKVLTGTKEHAEGRRVTPHSMKATCLSFCAKFGLTAEVRLQLLQPSQLELARVLKAIREAPFYRCDKEWKVR